PARVGSCWASDSALPDCHCSGPRLAHFVPQWGALSSLALRRRLGRLPDRFLRRRRLETAAFLLPLLFVVLLVSHYLENEHLLARVQDTGDQTVLVAADVEHDAVPDNAGRAELRFHVAPRLPRDGPAADVRIPCPERPLGVPMPRQFPERPQSRLGNDPHPALLLLSASEGIVVRKMRT